MSEPNKTSELKTVNCPTCKKQVIWTEQAKNRPFCSERCQLIDLGEWATEGHTIPGESLDHQGKFDA